MSHPPNTVSKPDLTKSSGGIFAKLMDQATRLGVSDETAGTAERNKKQVIALYAGLYRVFHADALYAAYKAGRSHVRTMATDEPEPCQICGQKGTCAPRFCNAPRPPAGTPEYAAMVQKYADLGYPVTGAAQ